jgi:hypothetical protein
MPYKSNSTFGFGRFLLLQKIWPFNGLVNDSMPVDLGHMTSWTWGHDVLDLSYDVLDKTRRYVEEDQDKSQDKMLR